MMKKVLMFLIVIISSLNTYAVTTDYHIGVVTGTVSQGEDSLRGAQELIKMYGDSNKGGKITHITYPDNFTQEMETTITQIVMLANDPKMKAIIVGEGVEGTTEAFRQIKKKRPDILLFVGIPHEDPDIVTKAADLVIDPDNISRGYLITKAAKKLGAKKIMLISFPRHMSQQIVTRFKNVMEKSAKELGMEFIYTSAPDPLSEVGVAGAQQFIVEKIPTWTKQYGKETAYYTTNNALTEPLLKGIATNGGIFVEQVAPSPTLGYTGAFGVKITDAEKGNWSAINKKVEKAVVAAGGSGRMGTWVYSSNFILEIALVKRAIEIIEKGGKASDIKALVKNFESSTPNTSWNARAYVDSKGIEKDNFIVFYQDTYIYGKGNLEMTEEKVPEKYFQMK